MALAHTRRWDGLIAHPDCTHMSLAGARWFTDPRFPHKRRQQAEAIDWWQKLWRAPVKRKCFENPQPLGVVMAAIGRYTQKVQPWQFGDPETKGVCLWLDNLPPLEPWVTERPAMVSERVWRMPPGPDRKRERSRFFPGISAAMGRWVEAGTLAYDLAPA